MQRQIVSKLEEMPKAAQRRVIGELGRMYPSVEPQLETLIRAAFAEVTEEEPMSVPSGMPREEAYGHALFKSDPVEVTVEYEPTDLGETVSWWQLRPVEHRLIFRKGNRALKIEIGERTRAIVITVATPDKIVMSHWGIIGNLVQTTRKKRVERKGWSPPVQKRIEAAKLSSIAGKLTPQKTELLEGVNRVLDEIQLYEGPTTSSAQRKVNDFTDAILELKKLGPPRLRKGKGLFSVQFQDGSRLILPFEDGSMGNSDGKASPEALDPSSPSGEGSPTSDTLAPPEGLAEKQTIGLQNTNGGVQVITIHRRPDTPSFVALHDRASSSAAPTFGGDTPLVIKKPSQEISFARISDRHVSDYVVGNLVSHTRGTPHRRIRKVRVW